MSVPEEVIAPYGVADDATVRSLAASIADNCEQYQQCASHGLPLGWKTYVLEQQEVARLINRILEDRARIKRLEKSRSDEIDKAEALKEALLDCDVHCDCGNTDHDDDSAHSDTKADDVWFDLDGDLWLLCNKCMAECIELEGGPE